ncbi:MAG: hypothetical protein ARM1_0646 [Candidatus Micrarchaeota archaeon]|nr:MAG: hypothetical protein ARM1_0646 [Candidatus Micrarchaeota archaeon]
MNSSKDKDFDRLLNISFDAAIDEIKSSILVLNNYDNLKRFEFKFSYEDDKIKFIIIDKELKKEHGLKFSKEELKATSKIISKIDSMEMVLFNALNKDVESSNYENLQELYLDIVSSLIIIHKVDEEFKNLEKSCKDEELNKLKELKRKLIEKIKSGPEKPETESIKSYIRSISDAKGELKEAIKDILKVHHDEDLENFINSIDNIDQINQESKSSESNIYKDKEDKAIYILKYLLSYSIIKFISQTLKPQDKLNIVNSYLLFISKMYIAQLKGDISIAEHFLDILEAIDLAIIYEDEFESNKKDKIDKNSLLIYAAYFPSKLIKLLDLENKDKINIFYNFSESDINNIKALIDNEIVKNLTE